jgi:hypothetical protein
MLRIESRARARDREIRKGSRAMAEAQASELEDDLARQRALAAEQAAGPVSAGFVAPATGEVATPFALPVAATALGASPGGPPAPVTGPRLHLTVTGTTITGSLDGDVEEAATLDELRLAAPALADAAGSATVVIADANDDAAAELAAEVVTVMRAAGVPTTLA